MPVKHAADVEAKNVAAGKDTTIQVLISSQEAPNFALRKFSMQKGGGMPRHTNTLEEAFTDKDPAVKRPVNLDPGYLEQGKIILASTKNFYHRMYLARGIFGEVTMHYRNNAWEFFPWTYPDYKSAEYQAFFLELRAVYRRQLRTRCQLKNSGDE